MEAGAVQVDISGGVPVEAGAAPVDISVGVPVDGAAAPEVLALAPVVQVVNLIPVDPVVGAEQLDVTMKDSETAASSLYPFL